MCIITTIIYMGKAKEDGIKKLYSKFKREKISLQQGGHGGGPGFLHSFFALHGILFIGFRHCGYYIESIIYMKMQQFVHPWQCPVSLAPSPSNGSRYCSTHGL